MSTDSAPKPPAQPILVAGYDGSETAAAAVRWAAAQISGGGRLVVVCAVHPQLPAAATAARTERARAGLEALWMEDDRLVDADVELLVADEAAAPALCRIAAAAGADGIVVGRHHAGPFNSDTVGQLLQIADQPVTVVPS